MKKKQRKAWAILNRFDDLWSQDLNYTKYAAEERIKKVCNENNWRESDFRVVECTVTFNVE